jgi:hypothetical protein
MAQVALIQRLKEFQPRVDGELLVDRAEVGTHGVNA